MVSQNSELRKLGCEIQSVADVAVIGAGPGGLVAAKSLLECGLEPVIFERDRRIGGLWQDGRGAWPGMLTNLSRHSCVFSDFPWPADSPVFPTREAVCGYLYRYAEAFGLLSRLRTGVTVEELVPDGDRWRLSLVDGTGKSSAAFRHVVPATGIFTVPFVPPVPDL